ncbi:zinc-binding dehydrogenase [Granulicella cerasi]|uniref:Zinc-binding dehydrogenase n=2 Tax=Granulicella cerasi TaxID=741063 RepID=A0ABW1Z579_9BACT
MSVAAALLERANLIAGETVLINGATGVSGKLAVQLARHFGAGNVIATGRNAAQLELLKPLGADVVIPFTLDGSDPLGARRFEQQLIDTFASGIDIVVDYLWGQSALSIMTAVVKGVDDARPARFIQVGSAGGEDSILLPAAGLRSSSLVLMGSGLKSVPFPALLRSVQRTFDAVAPANLQIDAKPVPLADVEATWNAGGRERIVFTI